MLFLPLAWLLLKFPILAQRFFKTASVQPFFRLLIPFQISVPKCRRAHFDKALEHLILFSSSHPVASRKDHVVATVEREEELIRVVTAIEWNPPIFRPRLANGTGILRPRHVKAGNPDRIKRRFQSRLDRRYGRAHRNHCFHARVSPGDISVLPSKFLSGNCQRREGAKRVPADTQSF